MPDPDQLGLPEQRQGLGPAGQHAKWKVVDPTGKTFGGLLRPGDQQVRSASGGRPPVGGVPVLDQGQNIWLKGGARPIELSGDGQGRHREQGGVHGAAAGQEPPKTVVPDGRSGHRRRPRHRRQLAVVIAHDAQRNRSNRRSRGASAPRDQLAWARSAARWLGIAAVRRLRAGVPGLPLYVVIHGALTTDATTSRWRTSRRPSSAVRVLEPAQEQPDPVGLDVARRRHLRHLAGGGGGRGKPRRHAAPHRLERLGRARLLRRRAAGVRLHRHARPRWASSPCCSRTSASTSTPTASPSPRCSASASPTSTSRCR